MLKIQLKEKEECYVPELGLASKQGLSKPEPLSTARDPLFCCCRSAPVHR